MLGSSLCAVPLQSDIFAEPDEREPTLRGLSDIKRRAVNAARREERIGLVLYAIDRLILWAKAERHVFMERQLGVGPRQPRGLK